MEKFDNEEKEKAFDRLAALYYERNFGSTSKVNLDILMFLIYIEHRFKKGSCIDDYSLSKELGISQTKVRTLKQSAALQYPNEYSVDWRAEFADCAKNARYDKTKQLVKMTIPEVTTLAELRHLIVENGLYDEYQLNPRLFQCRLDVFVKVCSLLEENGINFDSASKKSINSLKAKIPDEEGKTAIEKICSGEWKDGLLDLSRSAGKEILIEVLDLIPFSGIAKAAIRGLCNAIEKS